MALSHDVTLALGSTGTRLSAWEKYDLVLDMFEPGSPWTFTLWHSATPESAWRKMLSEVRLGDTVTASIDGAPVLTGRIEERRVAVGESGATLTISGRDLAGPALTWDADPRLVLRNRTVENALAELFNRVGIEVVVGAGANAAREVATRVRPGSHGAYSGTGRSARRNRVDLSRARPNETVWQVAESICRKLGYMMWVAPSETAATKLALVVDVPDYDHEAVFTLERRLHGAEVTRESAILESELALQIRDVPTVVYAFGRAPRGDLHPSRHAVATQATEFFHAPDPAFLNFDSSAPPSAAVITAPPAGSALTTRLPYANDELARWPAVMSPLPPQPKFLHTRRALNPATGRKAAERCMADAMRKFRTYTCTVQGHGQPVGGAMRLYAINTMAHVHDRVTELDEEMLITRVQYSGGREAATTTRLTLGTKGAVALEPEAA